MCYYISFLSSISSVNSQRIFIKFGFPESPWNSPGLDWKKIRKNPDSGKKPDSKIFRIFSKIIFSRNFVIIKCFPFLDIIIFKAAMVFLKIGMKKSLAHAMFRRNVSTTFLTETSGTGCCQIVRHLNRAWFENLNIKPNT